ncbi:unnamed protein product [Sphenostylis stenocarpa]|uniref:Uncharacterized protein n=1 Tax=Sphenostylis stenocarpa TaxID=92480 RepID=A0AA86TD50_9FABA|nr:unnamed protein product [Sphenostylis stenocarpa]
MAEEFMESEVVFSDSTIHEEVKVPQPPPRRLPNSKPVTIPERMVRRWGSAEVEEEAEEMTPPHEILRRRVAAKMAFSVCTGNGRTLKGRDLSQTSYILGSACFCDALRCAQCTHFSFNLL